MKRFYVVTVTQEKGREAESREFSIVAEDHCRAIEQVATQIDATPTMEVVSVNCVTEVKAEELERLGKN